MDTITQRRGGEPPRDAPHILIEHSEYWLSNLGDLAMMDVTIRRLRERWPAARIGVLTDTPQLMHAYFPDVVPVDPRGSSAWSRPNARALVSRRAGPRLVGPVAIGWVTARALLPQAPKSLWRKGRRLLRLRPRGPGTTSPSVDTSEVKKSLAQIIDRRASPNTLRAAKASSLVLAMGGGYLTDQDVDQSARVLSLLEAAHKMGIPTAMLGQGVGPIDDPALFARASSVLPSVSFIALRERLKGPEIMGRVGVDASRIEVSGDDAIELAYHMRQPDIGGDIGVCLRVADYSPVSQHARKAMTVALQKASLELNAGLVPVIIAEYRSQDRRSTLPLLRGSPKRRRPLGRFARPQDVAAQIGRCRVMVTGAYHAAVFALSQGIPVVALSSSTYYDDKFLGLADMFGSGLQIIGLDAGELEQQVEEAVRSAWSRTPQDREALLQSAAEQVATSRQSFNRACNLV